MAAVEGGFRQADDGIQRFLQHRFANAPLRPRNSAPWGTTTTTLPFWVMAVSIICRTKAVTWALVAHRGQSGQSGPWLLRPPPFIQAERIYRQLHRFSSRPLPEGAGYSAMSPHSSTTRCHENMFILARECVPFFLPKQPIVTTRYKVTT